MWPVHSANANETELCILNDVLDPACEEATTAHPHTHLCLTPPLCTHYGSDIYTNVATPLGDAYFFFPMMYDHFDTVYSRSRECRLLEARMAVSRDGQRRQYISREAGLSVALVNTVMQALGFTRARLTRHQPVARGLFQVGDETWLMGWGSDIPTAVSSAWPVTVFSII